ncbi:TetR/AcrR family transcriptional regulator [Chitinophaga pinensis]|uniref:TetR/AcrR family transcriptional regulator n=1 Tax=Chitinophaga pinensis TaxID=79329 RepID=A0A5C6LIQ1_9BACT|nr:TetR/AcrR family transcriptional regulator [Chitinophaga pinensis]TWV92987.1 TetR/AcrR family transcriptional regulator [Chitinophaga pinensis]
MKFTPRSETTRQFIIESVANLMNRQGYAGTSITDLEKATGLTKGSIYGNFENKEQIAYAVFDYNLLRLRQAINSAMDKCDTNKEKILANITVYYGSMDSSIGGCPMMNTAVEADDTHDGLRKRAADGLLRWKQDLVTLIEKGITAKEFKKDTDAQKTALTIIALIEGAILIGKATQNPVFLDVILTSAKETVHGISLH